MKKIQIVENNLNKEIKLNKIVPILAFQNSLKNNFLNIIYDFDTEKNAILTGNKFINIFRYNPEIKEPKFFHLVVKYRNNNYIFYQDKQYIEKIGWQNIIKEKEEINKYLENNKDIKTIDNIYITEINSISFPEHKNYFLQHSLCDFPLFLEDKIKNENVIEEKEDVNENLENVDIKSFNRQILEIMKNKIDNFIIIYDINNHQDEINYKIILESIKIINKKIVNSLILIDISRANGKIANKLESYVGNFLKYFQDSKLFNYCFSKSIQMNLIQFKSELLMSKYFYHFLRFHFCIYKTKDNEDKEILEISESKPHSDKFLNYFTELIQNDAKELNSKLNTIDEKEILEINNAIKELNEKEHIQLPDINKEDIEDTDSVLSDEEEIDYQDILKMIYIYFKTKKMEVTFSYEIKQFVNYFGDYELNQKEFSNMSSNFDIKYIEKNNSIIIENLNDIILRLEQVNMLKKKIKNTIANFKSDIEFLKEQNQNIIYIPFLGLSNSGKSTILNAIIGKEILSISLGECTKKGFIISYSGDNEPDITIGNAELKSSLIDKKIKYYFEYKNIIAHGFSNVKKILNSLNYEYGEIKENSFYYIRTKIKLFDDMHLKEDLKKKIFFIDFPGYGTKNSFENDIYPKIFEFCNCFAFIVRDSKINEKENKDVLNKALEVIEKSHKKLTVNGFIKSCFFICNIFDNTQTDKEEDIIKAKKDIKKLTNVENEDDINVCFIRALEDLDNIKNLNFFFDIEETINKEYDKFNNNNIFYYQIYIKNSSFEEYFNDIISKKLKEIGFIYQSIDKISIPEINEIKNKIENFPLVKFPEQLKEEISKKLYFARKYLKGMFSYGNFEIGFRKLIDFTFNEMEKNKIQIIHNQIDVFNKIFGQQYSEKITPESYNDLQEIEKDFKNELEKLFICINNKSKIKMDICSRYLSNINDNIDSIKQKINNLLKEKDWNIIKEDIKKEIFIIYTGLSMAIEKFIDEINKEVINLIKIKEKITVWNENLKLNVLNYKDFFMNKVSQRGIKISEEVKNELNKCFEDTKTQIWKNKTFFDWLGSCFSDEKYLHNFVDIINYAFKNKLDYILQLILLYFEEYKNQMIRLIEEKVESIGLEFINLEPKELEQLKKFCEPKIINIKKIIDSQLNNE